MVKKQSKAESIYECIAFYVDNPCIAAEKSEELISIFKKKYKLKVKGDGKLAYHLGAEITSMIQMELWLVNPRNMWRS